MVNITRVDGLKNGNNGGEFIQWTSSIIKPHGKLWDLIVSLRRVPQKAGRWLLTHTKIRTVIPEGIFCCCWPTLSKSAGNSMLMRVRQEETVCMCVCVCLIPHLFLACTKLGAPLRTHACTVSYSLWVYENRPDRQNLSDWTQGQAILMVSSSSKVLHMPKAHINAGTKIATEGHCSSLGAMVLWMDLNWRYVNSRSRGR